MKYLLTSWLVASLLCILGPWHAALAADETSVEQWGIYELSLKGPTAGNPFTDVTFSATFTQATLKIEVPGFYDGDGIYRIRFMPPTQGHWNYETHSRPADLDGKTGGFTSTKPTGNNHGPVVVAPAPRNYHFAYADGSPFYPFGTTCYAWTHQGDKLEEQTLASLKASPFNKIRMCVFPKSYDWNHNEPVYYPFEGKPPTEWDFTRFNPAYFQHLEKRIGQLRDLGIESDLILFHPYDRWGFARMGAPNDDRYLRYVIARLSAYRNIWWSLANEYDFMRASKAPADWDRFFHIVESTDPSHHLRSIHNGGILYNATQPWVTHVSIQNGEAVEDVGRAWLFRQMYEKPVMMDEVKYEGNITSRWGQLSGQEMTYRFWVGMVSGVYVTHGETLADDPQASAASDPILWWAKGGTLHGQSPARIAFLRKIAEAGPPLEIVDYWEDLHLAGDAPTYYLRYFGKEAPAEWIFELPRPRMKAGLRFHVDILDTWDMTITPVEQVFTTVAIPGNRYRFRAENNAAIKLPGKPYMALRITALP